MENEFEKLGQESLFPANRSELLPGGYMGKILRVDLSTRKVVEDNLPEESVLRKYLGGQALAQLFLLHELPRDVTPLDPENRLVFMTGPLAGTRKTPAGTAYSVTTFSNITRFGSSGKGAVVTGCSTGFWASYLKFAGYDGIIISGASKTPVYLWINNGKTEIREASGIWGKDTHESIEAIKRELDQPRAKVAAIGPAGENLVSFAMVVNDHNHSAAHGAGVVMGSKNLKAIAVYGTKNVPVNNPAKLLEAGKSWRGKLTPHQYPKVRHGVGFGGPLRTLINRNFQSTILPQANADFDKQEYTPRTCYACEMQCPYDVKLTTGKHAGDIYHLNGGSESIEGAAFTFGITGPDVFYLTNLLNSLGIEASHFGCAAGLAFEAYAKGLITARDTDGLELEWGNADVVEKLIRKVATRDGWLGNAIADGVKAVANKIGGEAHALVANIKGGAPAMHDWRPYTGMMLGQMVSSGGVKSQFSAYEILYAAPDLGYAAMSDRASAAGKGKEVLVHGSNKLFCGAAGVCWFGEPIGRPGIYQNLIDSMIAVTGWEDFSKEEALMVGERAWQMEHILHLRYGWTPEEDLTNFGPRLREPIPDGPFQGFTFAQFLPDLVYDFYRQCGWNEATGLPALDTLKRMGLENLSFVSQA